jgi:hypothetical protein
MIVANLYAERKDFSISQKTDKYQIVRGEPPARSASPEDRIDVLQLKFDASANQMLVHQVGIRHCGIAENCRFTQQLHLFATYSSHFLQQHIMALRGR